MTAAALRCAARRLRAGALQASPSNPTNRTRSIASSQPVLAPSPSSSASSPSTTTTSTTAEPGPPLRLPAHPATLPRTAPPAPAPSSSASRRDRIREAKPFSDFLTDTFHRQHDYLRISVTERCNLRCVYCMPEEGVPLSPPKELLTTPEIVMLSSLFVSQGVTKIRLTGGEPTVRRDIVPLMQQIGALRAHGLRELCLTTNGLSLHRKLDLMVEAGLTGVNLSLDTLDPWQFQIMTRRAGFSAVQNTMNRIFELNKAGAGIKFKINCVVMRGLNDREILPFVEMTRDKDVEVRFIEYMPFDGNKWSEGKMFSYQEMLDVIRARYPDLERVADHKNDTSKTFQVPGFAGRVGFITSMTHNFCGTCNRLRITGDGNLKVCLFGNAEVSLRDIIRQVNKGEPIDEAAFQALYQAATQNIEGPTPQHMVVPNSEELLNVIGMAVKRKKEKHAGIGELEHMKNRPMILIDAATSSHSPPRAHPRWHPAGLPSPRLPHPSLPAFMIPPTFPTTLSHARLFSTTPIRLKNDDHPPSQPPQDDPNQPKHDQQPTLTHITPTGAARMVSIASKSPTHRVAIAKCTVRFSRCSPAPGLIRANQMKKGDVLGVARVAGIMAAKRTPDLVPLCHPISLAHAEVELVVVGGEAGGEGATGEGEGVVEVTATVSCEGKTGVEMEALTAASVAALTVYDMCKAVDKGMVIGGLRVALKEGGKSGRWVEGGKVEESG
ncbi:hypothetical protein C8A05DRAFT_44686 [Staphylotrichum tortipilum]|uniref:Radical SAM core domain-containing protein n=1 Tax=Staphylotrichum tortipilum TaxID=2831512 RepID=A0AAN6RSF2_9PEZI|nr:hypothetical protein C8A05DRAFT_44686 [Staphylotrichum longicolle]